MYGTIDKSKCCNDDLPRLPDLQHISFQINKIHRFDPDANMHVHNLST